MSVHVILIDKVLGELLQNILKKKKKKKKAVGKTPPCDIQPLMHTSHGNKWNTCNTVCTNHELAYR